MIRILYLVIWGACLRPLSKLYNAPCADDYGLDSEITIPFDFREGDGYLFTIITEFDPEDTKTPLEKFILDEPEDGRILRASLLSHDGGIVKLSSEDLRYFEPGMIVEATPYIVDSQSEAEALLDDLEPHEYVEEFPAMIRHYADELDDYQLF